MGIRQSQVDKILKNRKAFFAARDAGNDAAKARAASAWRAAMTNATDEENEAARAQWPRPACRLCGAPNVTHVERWGRYCSDECARIDGEWLAGKRQG